jgi:hypothetical protein
MKSQKHRNQAADLILLDDSGNDLVFTSAPESQPDGSMRFEVGENKHDGSKYRVTLKIEELPGAGLEPEDSEDEGGGEPASIAIATKNHSIKQTCLTEVDNQVRQALHQMINLRANPKLLAIAANLLEALNDEMTEAYHSYTKTLAELTDNE